MRRVSAIWSAIVVFAIAAPASGEQQVKLQSGATLVGNVSAEGTNLVVNVDGAKIPVALKDVASVTPVSSSPAKDAQALLVRALEAQLVSDGENQELGLLKEAFRLAPEDPQIAFWYARSLVNSGVGKGANEVFASRREAIQAAYPGAVDQLAKRIEERLTLEKLPAALVKRLDKITESAKQPLPVASDDTTYIACFQLVDQNGFLIERSDFGIEPHGGEGKLDSFDDGYHLYTYTRNNRFHHNPCTLEVSRPGYASKNFSFEGSATGYRNLGVFQVKRFQEHERRQFELRVMDPRGKPLSGASVLLTSASHYANSKSIPPMQTNFEGVATALLFPNQYHCHVTRRGFNSHSQPINLPEGDDLFRADAKLYRAIQATIRVEWRGKASPHLGMPGVQNNSYSNGKFEQTVGPNGRTGGIEGMFGPAWVQLVQTDDKLSLQFQDQPHFRDGGDTWAGRLRPEKDDSGDGELAAEVNAELFDVLALGELDSLVEEFKIERISLGRMNQPNGTATLPIEEGDIYLGRINGRDPGNGRPGVLEFKILATDVTLP